MTELSRYFSYFFLVISFVYCSGEWTDFKVPVNEDGTYSIIVADKVWLKSAPLFVYKDGHRWEIGSPTYELIYLNTTYEVTPDGLYNTTTMLFSYGYSEDYVAFSWYYSTFGQSVIFGQHYLTGAENTTVAGKFNTTIAGFPCFQVTDAEEDLGFLSFGGYMVGDTDKTLGRFTNSTNNINDGINYGPLALFNELGQAVVIAPVDNFMAASMWHEYSQEDPSGHLSWGIMGGVNSIPANFSFHTALYFSDSISGAFETYGNSQNYTVREERRKNAENDVTLRYLGYWTDNGAYYYYNPMPNKTYEETLIEVKQYAEMEGIPYRYLQLDSWWYPKDPESSGVMTWTAMSSVFPKGQGYLSNVTGWKFSAHNRFWSSRTPYAKQNNGTYDFVVEPRSSLPHDPYFWRDLFQEASNWGLIVYEQDWLNVQTMYLTSLQTSLTLGRDWLMQMGQGAAENGLTIQYCMSMSRHILQSLEIPVVTQARASDDFLYIRPNQWKIGISSIFANAVGIMPFKDTFWTTKDQPGNGYNRSSIYPPAMEAAISSLSRGPVGPGDMVDGTNKTLLMMCCNTEGLLLRPSRPALAIDKQIVMLAFGTDIGEVWTTTSLVPTMGHEKEYGILFAADVKGSLILSFRELMFKELKSGVYFPYNDVSNWNYFNTSSELDLTGCTVDDFCIYYFSPLLDNGPVEAILGDVTKWVPMSSDRVRGLTYGKTDVVVSLYGSRDETAPMTYLRNGKVEQTECTLKSPDCIVYVGNGGFLLGED